MNLSDLCRQADESEITGTSPDPKSWSSKLPCVKPDRRNKAFFVGQWRPFQSVIQEAATLAGYDVGWLNSDSEAVREE